MKAVEMLPGNKKIAVDERFFAIKDFFEMPEDKNEKTGKKEKPAADLIVLKNYESLSEEEKERLRLLDYKKDTDDKQPKHEAYRKDSVALIQYKDAFRAMPRTTEKDDNLREKLIINNKNSNYFGIDFDALNHNAFHEHFHGHGAKKETHYAMSHDAKDHNHDVKEYAKHGDAGHFHSDGTYHAQRHEQKEQNHSSKSHAYDNNCGGCNPSYVDKASPLRSVSLFISKAA